MHHYWQIFLQFDFFNSITYFWCSFIICIQEHDFLKSLVYEMSIIMFLLKGWNWDLYLWFFVFWTLSLPDGVHSFHPRLVVSQTIIFINYFRDRSLVFSESLHEVRGQESEESDTAGILKKILIWGLQRILGIFFETTH